MNFASDTYLPPLTPQVFYILVALSYRSLHAYAIRQQVASDSSQAVVLGDSTIHDALKRLLARGWLEIDQNKAVKPKAYRLTTAGRILLEAELRRLKRAILVAEIALNDGRFIT